jgi:hypothetical protein
MSKHEATMVFYAGMREGMAMYAHWKDGTQYVGTCGTTLKEAIRKINDEEQRALDKIDEARELRSELGYSRVGLNNV